MQPCLLTTAMGVRVVTNIPTHIHHHTILRIDAIGLMQPYCPTHHNPIHAVPASPSPSDAHHAMPTIGKTWWQKRAMQSLNTNCYVVIQRMMMRTRRGDEWADATVEDDDDDYDDDDDGV